MTTTPTTTTHHFDIPAIETERLLLRGHRRDDFDEAAAMWGDPEVTRYIGGKPFTREEVWSRLLRYIGHWALNGYGFWAVRERETGRFVGEVGLADFKRAGVEPLLGGAPECGWVLAAWAHGRGFATEAVRAVVDWSALRFGVGQRVVCLIAPGNLASIQVAQKCGFHEFARTTYHDEPTVLFER